MRAESRPAAGPAAPGAGSAVPIGSSAVDGTEAGCGEGGEHERVRPDGLRDTFTTAGGAGVEELPHVAGVLVGAGRADRRAAVPAADEQHPVGFGVGAVAGAVRPVDESAKPNRSGAVAAASDLVGPPVVVVAAGAAHDLVHGPRPQGRGGHGRLPVTAPPQRGQGRAAGSRRRPRHAHALQATRTRAGAVLAHSKVSQSCRNRLDGAAGEPISRQRPDRPPRHRTVRQSGAPHAAPRPGGRG